MAISSFAASLPKTKTLLVSFADGDEDFFNAGLRLERQAAVFGMFTKIVILSGTSLAALGPDYALAVQSWRELDNHPLYYRAAKSWVLKAALEGQFGSFDFVCYLDAGCEINSNDHSRRMFSKLLGLAARNTAFAETIRLREYEWTKPETAIGMKATKSDLRRGQVQSTWSIWKVCETAVQFAEEWCRLSSPKLGFWQNPGLCQSCRQVHVHRHDQSIFSLLWKSYGLPEYDYKLDFDSTAKHSEFRRLAIPIITWRNRTGKSQIQQSSNYKWGSFAASIALNKVNSVLRGTIFRVLGVFVKLPKCFQAE